MKKIMHIIIWLGVILVIMYIVLVLMSREKYPVQFGISFNQHHAMSLGLDWKESYEAMLTELHPKFIRIAAMWNDIEKSQGTFDFSDVDWMMNEAKKYDVKVTLVVGQKAPRWPECHVPGWASELPDDHYKEQLFNYVTHVVDRYKKHPALELWQVENEPFIRFEFGDCQVYHQDFVDEEIALVKSLDDARFIMVTDSGELGHWRQSGHAGDIFGTTLYRIVRLPNGWRWTYDWMPASVYRLRARMSGIPLERLYVAELQAEPWFTDIQPQDTPIAIQEETMNIDRLKKHIDYVERIGTTRAYLWGVEWWYWMKTVHGDSSYWNYVKQVNDK